MAVHRRSAFRVWIWVGAIFPWPLRSVPTMRDHFLAVVPRGFFVLMQIVGRAPVVLLSVPTFLHSELLEASQLVGRVLVLPRRLC